MHYSHNMLEMPSDFSPIKAANSTELGSRVRDIRKSRGWKLKDLALRSGLAVSTISKMERGEISLTYERFMRLAQGLGLDIGELFNASTEGFSQGAIAIERDARAVVHETDTYRYEMLHSGLAHKHMIPMRGFIKAHSLAAFESPISHPGEEFVYVVQGKLQVHFENAETVTLRKGDSIYFDSSRGHAYVSTSKQDACVIAVCWRA